MSFEVVSWPERFIFVFSLVSFVVYMVVLFVLLRNVKTAPLNNYYYHLVISLGVSDLLNGLWLYVGRSFRYWGWIDWRPLYFHETFGWWFRASTTVLHFYLMFVQYLGALNIGLNRYYNIVKFNEELWTRDVQWVALFGQWTAPLVVAAPLCFQDYYVSVRNTTHFTYVTALPPAKFYSLYLLVTLLLSAMVTAAMSVMYAKITIAVRKLRTEYNLTEQNKAEIKLAMVGLALFLMLFVYVIEGFGYLFAMIFKIEQLRALFAVSSANLFIIFTFCNPWLLLLCSKQLTNAIGNMCFQNGVQPL